MRLEENGNLSEHLLAASELVHRLTRMGESLKEHLVVAILLSSLPESYSPLVTALEGRPEEDLKVDYVKGKLLDEWRRKSEIRVQASAQENDQESAMKSTAQFGSRRSVRVCYYCGRGGHFQRSCPVLLEETKASMKQQEEAKSISVEPMDSGSDGVARQVCFAMTTESAVTPGKWIIDTGCTKHMTNAISNLGWWNPCSEDVILADGKKVRAKGHGEGRILGVRKDGEQIDVTLKEVLYVPGLSKNVLSVSQITEDGFKVIFGHRSCQIMGGDTVIAVGEKSGGLYYLKY